MMLPLYRFLGAVGSPVISFYLNRRKAQGKEDPVRFGERLGVAGLPRPNGRLVWLHAASVGESLSMLPLIDRLISDYKDIHVLVTTGTVSSARLMEERLPERAFHQYVPVDRVPYVRRFLGHWRPDLALWSESEFWPNLVCETAAHGIPLVLVNGRISPRSFAGWMRFRSLISVLLAKFSLCLGQTESDVTRLRKMGAGSAKCVGNLKFAVPPLPVDESELARLRSAIGSRPRWVAASTHPGEEEIAARVHAGLKNRHPKILTIIVPRHPGRGQEITNALRSLGLEAALRSKGDEIQAQTDVYVADSVGEMGLFYRLADIVFMGKSLVPLGGQNPLEAMRLSCAVLHGPHMANFEEISRRMDQTGAALMISDENTLCRSVEMLLGDGEKCANICAAGMEFATGEAGVIDGVMAELASFIDTIRSEDKKDRARA